MIAHHFKTAFIATILGGILLLFVYSASYAHCDTLDGPVVTDARTALLNGDVSPVLKWVKADDEQTIREAFGKTLEVRGLSEDAREMADLWFFETLVRIHRAGEGEPFTGVKPAGSVTDKVILMADQTIEDGSADGFAAKIASHAQDAIKQRFSHLMELSAYKDNSPEEGRAWVTAYVEYIHFAKAVADVVHGHHGHGNSDQEAEHN